MQRLAEATPQMSTEECKAFSQTAKMTERGWKIFKFQDNPPSKICENPEFHYIKSIFQILKNNRNNASKIGTTLYKKQAGI